MTDRVGGFLVTLEHELREDDAQGTLDAIRRIRGVVSVSPVVAEPYQETAATRERLRLGEAVSAIFWPKNAPAS